MTDDKKWPEYPGPGPFHPRCRCYLYGLDEETTAQLKAIAEEIDRRMMEPLKNIDPGDMTGYYETLEGHFKKKQ